MRVLRLRFFLQFVWSPSFEHPKKSMVIFQNTKNGEKIWAFHQKEIAKVSTIFFQCSPQYGIFCRSFTNSILWRNKPNYIWMYGFSSLPNNLYFGKMFRKISEIWEKNIPYQKPHIFAAVWTIWYEIWFCSPFEKPLIANNVLVFRNYMPWTHLPNELYDILQFE